MVPGSSSPAAAVVPSLTLSPIGKVKERPVPEKSPRELLARHSPRDTLTHHITRDLEETTPGIIRVVDEDPLRTPTETATSDIQSELDDSKDRIERDKNRAEAAAARMAQLVRYFFLIFFYLALARLSLT